MNNVKCAVFHLNFPNPYCSTQMGILHQQILNLDSELNFPSIAVDIFLQYRQFIENTQYAL